MCRSDNGRGAARRVAGLCASALIVWVGASCSTSEAQKDPPALARQTSVDDAAALGVGGKLVLPRLVGLDGRTLEPAELFKGRRAVVIAMTSTGCPMSRRYGPRLGSLEKEYGAREGGVAFVYVNTVAAETDPQMREQARENGWRGAYLPDRDQAVAVALGARTTTEVFVLDDESRLVYRGAVDDQYGVGTALSSARHTYLRDALDAVLAGGDPEVKATWAPGCLVDLPARVAAAAPARAESLTYFGRVAGILEENCVACHAPQGVAPFSLASQPDIEGRLAMIEAVVRDGLMPPSHGNVSSEVGVFGSPRAMPENDRADLLAWLRSSRPLGDPAGLAGTHAAARPSQDWAIGGPDVLLVTPGLRLPAEGPLMHSRAVLATTVDHDTWIAAAEFRPMKPDTVHHALVWLVPPGAVLPAESEMPVGLELLGVFSPAQGVVRYPEGVARRLPAGSSVLVDMYARPMGLPMMSMLRIGLRLTDERPREEVRTIVVADDALRIGAGARGEGGAEVVLDQSSRVLALIPYMRARGTALRLAATTGASAAGGDAATVLEAPDFDFRWQLRYEFAEPVLLSAGTKLELRGGFDNTSANANNPDPAAIVGAGPGAGEEALFVALEVLVPAGGSDRQ